MPAIRVSRLILVALAMLLATASAGSATTFVQVTRPNGGETIELGSSQRFEWTSDGGGTIKIELLKGGVLVRTLTPGGGVVNGGAVTLTFPGDVAVGTDYRVQISSIETPAATDTSNANFRVAEPSDFVLNSPVAGESWELATTHDILWTSNVDATEVDITLKRGGTTVATVASNTPNDGSVEWTIPPGITPASDYRIRIEDDSDSEVYSESAAFSIVAYTALVVTFPNGGEALPIGSVQGISWTGPVGHLLAIELYKAGDFYTSIAAVVSTATASSYNWTIPSWVELGADYRIVVTSIDDPTRFDESDTGFSIIPAGQGITVISPNGGESIATGGDTTIRWSGPAGQAVWIDLYKGGEFDSVVTDSVTSGSGTYTWAVPADLATGSDYRVSGGLGREPRHLRHQQRGLFDNRRGSGGDHYGYEPERRGGMGGRRHRDDHVDVDGRRGGGAHRTHEGRVRRLGPRDLDGQ